MNNWNNFWFYMQSYANYDAWAKSMQNLIKTDLASEAKKMQERLVNINHDFVQEVSSSMQESFQSLQKNAAETYESWKSSIENQDYKEFLHAQQQYMQNSLSQATHFAKNMMDASTKCAKNMMDTITHHRNNDQNQDQ